MIRIRSHRILAVSRPDQGLVSLNPPSKSPNTRFSKRVLDVWEEDRIGEEHAPGNGKKDEAKNLCFTMGPWEGPHFSVFSDQKPRTLAACVADIHPLFHI